jgi:hypothetical protein
MKPEEFVKLVAGEKHALLTSYLANPPETSVGKRIERLHLNAAQMDEMVKIADEILTDAYYTLILGLDGCAQIGGKQIDYQIADEEGNVLTKGGDLEGYAWEYFHGDKAEQSDEREPE